MCQGFSHFSGFLHHFVMTNLATSSIKDLSRKNQTRPGLVSYVFLTSYSCCNNSRKFRGNKINVK